MNKSKSLQDLNLIDSFLFSASTENSQDAEYIAKLIIERATGRKIKPVSVMTEKQLEGVMVGEARGIKLGENRGIEGKEQLLNFF